MVDARRSPLYELALKQGASLKEWHGWELPLAYASVEEEYTAAEERATLHDASYVGRIKATGEDVLDLLNRLSTNEVVSLQPGQGAPTVLTTDRGRIIDVITVLNLGDHVLLITSPQSTDVVIEWIDKYTIVEDVVFEDVTASTAMLSVLGDRAKALLGACVGLELEFFEPYESALVTISGVEAWVIRRDLVDFPRFELIVEKDDAASVWDDLTSAGAVPMGMGAFEVLRIKAGAPLYGSELGDSYNPLETGLWGSISFTKGCYIGQEVVARLDTYKKVQKHLVRLDFSPDASAEAGTRLTREGREVGQITSVAKVPTTGKLVGLGYVRKDSSEPGATLDLAVDSGAQARVESKALPFGPGEEG